MPNGCCGLCCSAGTCLEGEYSSVEHSVMSLSRRVLLPFEAPCLSQAEKRMKENFSCITPLFGRPSQEWSPLQ
jgi:hypothetical protein